MAIKAYKEITDWEYANHTYLVDEINKDKMVGYIKDDETEPRMFKKPLSFYRARRKFKITDYVPA